MHPRRADSDGDGLSDGHEVRRTRTSPRSRDTDRDGLSDRYETRTSKTDPLRPDTDGDGVSDGREVLVLGSDPLDPSSPPPPQPPTDTTPPDTAIVHGPPSTTSSTTASFEFSSSESGSTFQCRLDAGSWGPCTSPRDYSGLALGSHTFEVRATDSAGNVDPTPASQTWSVASPPGPTPEPSPQAGLITSWIGNTFGGRNGEWIPHGMQAMAVAPDGTVYTGSHWEEDGREVAGYKDGKVFGPNPLTHGGGGGGPLAMAADDSYVYATGVKDHVSTLRRWSRASFDGANFDAQSDEGQSFTINPSIGYRGTAGGLAVRRGEIFVADPGEDYAGDDNRIGENTTIKVFSTDMSGRLLRSFRVPRARTLAFDGEGYLWVLQQGSSTEPARILRYAPDGTLQPQRITGIEAPISIAISGSRMLVGDNGRDQNVKIFGDITTNPTPDGDFGVEGGYLAAPNKGEVGPLRFDGPKGVGIDAAGNIYVASTGTAGIGDRIWSYFEYGRQLRLESYTPAGALRWQVQGLEFIDMASIDPGSETDLYTRDEHFVVDYSKPPGQGWTYKGRTLDPFADPDDGRIQRSGDVTYAATPWVRRIAGRRFLFMTDGNAGWLEFWRLGSDEIARQGPSFPRVPHSTTAWWPDSDGNVWQGTADSGIKRFRHQGLDASGNPIYSQAQMDSYPMPAPFAEIRRLQYEPSTDTLYIAGFTAANHDNASIDHWKTLGRTIARYDGWLAGNRTPTWTIEPLPYSLLSDRDGLNKPVSMSVAGDYVFVSWITNLPASDEHVIRVYRRSDGGYVDLIRAGAEAHPPGWHDIFYAIQAHKRANGEYLILAEEGRRGKVLVYRWTP